MMTLGDVQGKQIGIKKMFLPFGLSNGTYYDIGKNKESIITIIKCAFTWIFWGLETFNYINYMKDISET